MPNLKIQSPNKELVPNLVSILVNAKQKLSEKILFCCGHIAQQYRVDRYRALNLYAIFKKQNVAWKHANLQ